jgi:hypothetical protein
MAEDSKDKPGALVPADRLAAERARRKAEQERALFEAAAGGRADPSAEIIPLNG